MNLDIIHGDCLEVLPTMAAGSVDCVVTDPPYGQCGLWAYEALFREVPRLLRDNGCLLTILPHHDIRDIMQLDHHGLDWQWMLALAQSGGRRVVWGPQRGVMVGWKPIGWWAKNPRRSKGISNICDIRTSKKAEKDTVHPWQQPIEWAELCLWFMPKDGGTVLDPFLGSGTTLVAAARLGLNGIGIEQDAGYCDIARARVRAATEQLQLEVTG